MCVANPTNTIQCTIYRRGIMIRVGQNHIYIYIKVYLHTYIYTCIYIYVVYAVFLAGKALNIRSYTA